MLAKKIATATVTSKNQITIPKAVRQTLKVSSQDELIFLIDEQSGDISVKKAEKTKNLWSIVAEQKAQYGSLDDGEIDWGEDVGTEVID